jgi:hypothetical protein
MLSEYDRAEITSLIDSRIIYIIPVISPDSYPHSATLTAWTRTGIS